MRDERIVIANSVGIDSNGLAIIHSPSRWTNSSPDKNVFTYYPWELAYTSSLLKRDTEHRVVFLDGCLEKYDTEAYFERIALEKPTVLVMEPATRTWNDDLRLMQRVKAAFQTTLIVVGQHATAFPDEVARYADHVVLGEYEYTVLDIVRGLDPRDIPGRYPNARRALLDINSLPWPEDDDVSRIRYGVPGEPSSEYLEVQAYATRGCPMNCTFCVCRHLYYNQQNWRPRHTENIAAELSYLRNKYPQMEGIFFDEEFHNVGKKFILELSQELIAHKLNELKIEAMCAYYTLDEEMMDAMRAAGYYLLRVGIETAGAGAAKGIDLGVKFDLERLRHVLHYAKKIGLKMYGTFTFGAPGSTKKDDQATLDLMDEIVGEGLLWRFQTSICTPQPGAPFYDWAKEKGFLKTFRSQEYDGGNNVVLDYPDYSSEEIMQKYLTAQKYYDLAVKNRFSSSIDASIATLQEEKPSRVLFLRSSRMPQMEIIFRKLRHALSDIRIDVIAQAAVRDEMDALQTEGIINAAFYYTEAFFDSAVIPQTLRDALTRAHYDCAFLVYGNLRGRGYENAEKFLTALELGHWRAFNSEGRLLDQREIAKIREAEARVCENPQQTLNGSV
jgi:anaerobic magnesium-protoporphyrin IX monomethyl ester cyclase